MPATPAAAELFYPLTLDDVADLREILARVELELVAVARSQGFTWREIGSALGLSPQTAHRRFATAVRR